MYQEIINNCKKAYKEHKMELAYKYWYEMFELLEKKLDNTKTEEERRNVYTEYFDYMRQFEDNEVYDITDYGKEKAYKQMFRNQFQEILLNNMSGDYDLEILDNFCEFYEWQPVKTENGFNILDLQLDNLVEEQDYKTFNELVDRIVGRALDYYKNEHELNEDYIEEEYNNIKSLYIIAKKYIRQNKYNLMWLENVENYLKELKNLYLE